MRRIKIAHVIESLGPGGAEGLLATCLTHMDPERFENHVYYMFSQHELVEKIRSAGGRVTYLEMRNSFDWRRGFWRLRQLLRELKPDIVHTTLLRSDIYGRLAAASAGLHPIVSWVPECPYNPEVFIDNPELSRFKYGVVKMIDKATARFCNDAFFVLSEATRRNLDRYFSVDPRRVRLMYGAIDIEALDQVENDRVQRLRDELGIKPGERVLLNIGRLFQQKGQRYLIHAMRRVVDRCPDVRLVIRGHGGDRAELQALAASLDLGSHVTILAARPRADVLALLRLCDLFVFPSLYEGLGLALIEAMAMRRACVASNVGPIPEVVENGRTGLLVPSRDPEALADALLALLDDPDRRRRMGEEGRRVVEERFDIRKSARVLEQAFLDLKTGQWGGSGLHAMVTP